MLRLACILKTMLLGLAFSLIGCNAGNEGNSGAATNSRADGTISKDEEKYLPRNPLPPSNPPNNPPSLPDLAQMANACDLQINQNATIGGYSGLLDTASRGTMTVTVKELGGVKFLAYGCPVFAGNKEDPGACPVFSNGFVQEGVQVNGLLVIDSYPNDTTVSVKLNHSGKMIPVGTLSSTEINKTATITFDKQACLTRYRVGGPTGPFFSAGQGYIVVP